MKCKYCGYELPESATFCNNCGQQVIISNKSEKSEQFWSEIGKTKISIKEEYEKNVAEEKNKKRKRKTKSLISILCVLLIVIIAAVTVFAIGNNSKENMEQLKVNLPGTELTSFDSESLGPPLFTKVYHYYTLRFNDDETVDLYYLESSEFYSSVISGQKNEEYIPEFLGTYRYNISKKSFSEYTVELPEKTFILRVINGNEPEHLQCDS